MLIRIVNGSESVKNLQGLMGCIALNKCRKSSLRALEAFWRLFLIANFAIYHNRNNEHLKLIIYFAFEKSLGCKLWLVQRLKF